MNIGNHLSVLISTFIKNVKKNNNLINHPNALIFTLLIWIIYSTFAYLKTNNRILYLNGTF